MSVRKYLLDAIKSILARYNYRLGKFGEEYFLEPLLYRCLQQKKELFFIQIGANDGVSFDPLYSFVKRHRQKVKGIVVEPLRDLFSELSLNYRGYPNIIKVNRAIHNSQKKMKMYRPDPLKKVVLPDWSKGIASFNEDHHKLAGISGENIIIEEVECISFDELLVENGVDNIDLLQIDTEGYDLEIINNINFDRIKPEIIRFEHGMIDKVTSKNDFLMLSQKLYDRGYFIILEHYDAIAYLHHLSE
ncbi:MAG: FkbM family methyltransferase [bacterium]